MAKHPIKKSNVRLLLNAEPFGFGPTAAIASFFPHLRKHFNHIGYIGKNHTFDLQHPWEYDAIHDLSHLEPQHEEERIARVMAGYDIFFTALDFVMAQKARQAGLPVCIYDALAWYWRSVPTIAAKSDVYIAQDFFGVAERLRKEKKRFGENCHRVPPIMEREKPRRHGKHILVNLGGLQNPCWSVQDAAAYARAMTLALREVIPAKEVIITTSAAVAGLLKDVGVKSFTHDALAKVLAQTKYAFMTPGLGNMYDAARYGISTVWLPPANDSQGQQVQLLKRHAMCDGLIRWEDISPDRRAIDYHASQVYVLRGIASRIRSLPKNWKAQFLLRQSFGKEYTKIAQQQSTRNTLLKKFGSGGAEHVAKLVVRFAGQYQHR